MSAPAYWIQTSRSAALALFAPAPEHIDLLGEVPEVLARLPRFGGHVPSGGWSVAQHLTVGAEAILAETGSLALARAFALHDVHEYVIGDITTPVAQALEERTGAALAALWPGEATRPDIARLGRRAFRAGLRAQKADLDAAIHAAAGLQWPLDPDTAAAVHMWDIRMLRTERDQLLGPPPYPWADEIETAAPVRLRGRLTPWPWPRAADAYRSLLKSLFPHIAAADAAA